MIFSFFTIYIVTPYEFQTLKSLYGVKTNLMCRLLKLCKFKEYLFRDFFAYIRLSKVPNNIINHRSFNNIKIVNIPVPAFCYKIKPFLVHRIIFQNF